MLSHELCSSTVWAAISWSTVSWRSNGVFWAFFWRIACHTKKGENCPRKYSTLRKYSTFKTSGGEGQSPQIRVFPRKYSTLRLLEERPRVPKRTESPKTEISLGDAVGDIRVQARQVLHKCDFLGLFWPFQGQHKCPFQRTESKHA